MCCVTTHCPDFCNIYDCVVLFDQLELILQLGLWFAKLAATLAKLEMYFDIKSMGAED